MRYVIRSVLMLSAMAMVCSPSMAWCQAPQQQPISSTLIAAGSGVNLGITRLLAKAFMERHPEISIEVPGSIGTKGAITAIKDSAITFGLISRALKEEEKSAGVVAQPYARTPIVVAAHKTVVDDSITYQELNDIYRGVKTTWRDGNEIIVQTREPFDSGILVIQKEVPGFREAYDESREAKRWTVYFTDQDANHALSTTPYAIGFTDLGMIATEHLNVNALKLNGIVPGDESMRSGQYPLLRDLFFLYRSESLPAPAKAFLDFVRSEDGDKILEANGYLPLK